MKTSLQVLTVDQLYIIREGSLRGRERSSMRFGSARVVERLEAAATESLRGAPG